MRTALSILVSSVLVLSSTVVSSLGALASSADAEPARCCCKVKSSCGCGCEHKTPSKSGRKLPSRLLCVCDAPAVPTLPAAPMATGRPVEELATPLLVAIASISTGDKVRSHFDKFADPPDSSAPIASVILLI